MDCWAWRPILTWSLADVVAIHQRHGLKPAPPYLEGAERVGCAPCIMARKSEIAWLAERYPKRMAILADLEADVDRIRDSRNAEAGKPHKGYRLGWFYSKRGPPKGAPTYRPFWKLAEVIEWAQGPQNQVEMFAPDPKDFGCMRWGFCDAGDAGK